MLTVRVAGAEFKFSVEPPPSRPLSPSRAPLSDSLFSSEEEVEDGAELDDVDDSFDGAEEVVEVDEEEFFEPELSVLEFVLSLVSSPDRIDAKPPISEAVICS